MEVFKKIMIIIHTTTIGLSPFSRFAGSNDILSKLLFFPESHSFGVSSNNRTGHKAFFFSQNLVNN